MLQKEDEEGTQFVCRVMMGSCDHSNEFQSAIKCRQFFKTDKLLASKEGFFSRGVSSTVCIRKFITRECLADTAFAVATIHGLAWINEDRRVLKIFLKE
jgi:hypothetical protein